MHLFLATELSDEAAKEDPDELLEASWLSLDEALSAIDDGGIMDAKTIAGIGWLAHRLGR